jgi:hypothetical protein|tara:strand:- start:30097 stop:30687 length:591 start_codon:yes stop_codon:yes gene_type:complete
MASKINLKRISNKVDKSRKFQRETERRISTGLERTKAIALAEFNSHPVTKEIEGKASARNESGTLGGYGNLFTFIGFPSASSPTSVIRDIISQTIKFRRKKSLISKNKIKINFVISAPTKSDIFAVTPMPWEGGSWVEGIENGLSGFSYYMNKKFGESRSGGGLQADHEITKAIFTPKAYVTEILNKFRINVRRVK